MEYGHGDYNGDQNRVLASISIMMILSTVVFLLRLWARKISVARYWYDDYVVFVALVLSYGPTICVLVAVEFGLGKHAEMVGINGVKHVRQLAYFTQIFWQLTMPAVKTSLLLFYVRLFPGRRMRIVAYVTGAMELSFGISATVVDLVTCIPINAFWDETVKHHCIDTYTFYIVDSAMQLVTDVVVLLIPLPVVWSLRIGTPRKIGLSVIFLLGSIVCVASTMRIVLVGHFAPPDITGLAVDVAIWTCVEASLSVICACIPCLTPLVLRAMRKTKRTSEHTADAMNRTSLRGNFAKDNGFHRMNELSELGATFDMAIYGDSYADCRASQCLPDCELPPYGINVTKEVNIKQSTIRP